MEKVEEEVKEKEISMPESAYNAIMQRLSRLENPGVPLKLKREKNHIGHLRLWEDQLVIRVGQAYENLSIPEGSAGRLLLDIGVLSSTGEKKKMTVNYLDFIAHSPLVRVKFVKEERIERTETELEKGGGGMTNKRLVDKNGWASGEVTGEEIALEVGFIDVSIDVEVLEGAFKGQVISFASNAINAINA